MQDEFSTFPDVVSRIKETWDQEGCNLTSKWSLNMIEKTRPSSTLPSSFNEWGYCRPKNEIPEDHVG